jgi:release factor glutamine methyltransferase
VLVPRPESETIITTLLDLPQQPAAIVDVGTGSGALAITAKLLVPSANVFAIDIDEKCLRVARHNAKKHHTDITFLCGDLLAPLQASSLSRPIVLLCNLPYVPDNFQINTAALHEPRHALFGGPDGLDPYRKLFSSPAMTRIRPNYVITEALPPQHETLQAIAKESGYSLSQTDDFIQLYASEV